MADPNKIKKFLNPAQGWLPILILTAMLGAGFFFTTDQLPSETLCFLKRLFLFDCPGCGLTRSFLLIPRGEWRRVWELNPGAFVVYFAFLLWLLRLVLLKFKMKLDFLFHPLLNQVLGWCVISSLTIQWIHKVYVYFSDVNLSSYVAHLTKQPLLISMLIKGCF